MVRVRKAIVTCDECQTAQDAAMGDAAFGVLPVGWVTVAFDPPGGFAPEGIARKQNADLCSWPCAAAYAAKRAEDPVQPQGPRVRFIDP